MRTIITVIDHRSAHTRTHLPKPGGSRRGRSPSSICSVCPHAHDCLALFSKVTFRWISSSVGCSQRSVIAKSNTSVAAPCLSRYEHIVYQRACNVSAPYLSRYEYIVYQWACNVCAPYLSRYEYIVYQRACNVSAPYLSRYEYIVYQRACLSKPPGCVRMHYGREGGPLFIGVHWIIGKT